MASTDIYTEMFQQIGLNFFQQGGLNFSSLLSFSLI